MRTAHLIVTLAAAFLLATVDAIAQDSLLYVTDRAAQGTSFTGKRNYQHEPLNYYRVPVTTAKGSRLGQPEPLRREEFLAAVQLAQQKCSTNEVAVFVHGYNQKAPAVMDCGWQLQQSMGVPVVVFDWPSVGRLRTYMVDECNIEWAQRDFALLMNGLIDQVKAQNLTTVSHSMGNRLVCAYLSTRFDMHQGIVEEHERDSTTMAPLVPFKEVVLTSPDVDRATFKNFFYKAIANTNTLRLYVSNRDKPLRFSGFLHGGYSRLGAGAVGENDVRWKMPAALGGNQTQTINFTLLDDRLIGHTIQFDLIAAMHKNSRPPDQYRLEPAENTKANYFTLVKNMDHQPRPTAAVSKPIPGELQ